MINIKLDTAQIRDKLVVAPELIDKAVKSTLYNVLKGKDSPIEDQLLASLRAAVPTGNPFTLGGNGKTPFYVKAPTVSGNVMTTTIGVMGKQASYLQFMVKGINRDDKIIERRNFMGRMMVPSNAIKLDKYGNVPRAEYRRIFSAAKNKSDGFFYIPNQRGKQAPGIYQRTETGARPMFFAIDSASYRVQWDFYTIAQSAIMKYLPDAMNEAIAHRLKAGK